MATMIIYRVALAFLVAIILVSSALPAYAELGPYKPLDQREVLICGSGNGVAK